MYAHTALSLKKEKKRICLRFSSMLVGEDNVFCLIIG